MICSRCDTVATSIQTSGMFQTKVAQLSHAEDWLQHPLWCTFADARLQGWNWRCRWTTGRTGTYTSSWAVHGPPHGMHSTKGRIPSSCHSCIFSWWGVRWHVFIRSVERTPALATETTTQLLLIVCNWVIEFRAQVETKRFRVRNLTVPAVTVKYIVAFS